MWHDNYWHTNYWEDNYWLEGASAAVIDDKFDLDNTIDEIIWEPIEEIIDEVCS